MTPFRESDLTLHFDESTWVVRRYDAHPFYGRLKAHGYAGVDFLLLHRREHRAVWLEVKNYRARRPGLTPEHLPAYVADPAVLAEALARKRRDTARGLAQIARHYRERFWWGLGGRYLAERAALRGGRLRDRDFALFPLLHRLVGEARRTTYAAVVELDEAYPGIADFEAVPFRSQLARELGPGTWVGPAAGLTDLLVRQSRR